MYKSMTLLSAVAILLMLTSTALPAQADRRDESDDTRQGRWIIDPDLFGFHTASLFAHTGPEDQEFMTLIDALGPQLFRFPGGAFGNYYHRDGKAYGYREEDFLQVPPAVGRRPCWHMQRRTW